MKLPKISILPCHTTGNATTRLLRKPVYAYLRIMLNRTCITAPANAYKWNTLAGIARCNFWQAINAAMGSPFGKPKNINAVELLWRYVDDRLQLAIRYQLAGTIKVVPVTHKVEFHKTFDFRIKLPGYKKGHNWGFYIPTAMGVESKAPFTCNMVATIGHQAKDAYEGKL